jgi:hypothetical protein
MDSIFQCWDEECNMADVNHVIRTLMLDLNLQIESKLSNSNEIQNPDLFLNFNSKSIEI